MKRCISTAIIWIAIGAMCSPPALAAEPVAVAVLNFANQVQGPAGEEWDWLEKGLADLLINDLAQHPQLQMVSREQMQLAILRMEHDSGLPPEWQQVIAKQLKAVRAVFGSFRVDGEKITIHATVLDMLSGRPVNRTVVEGMAANALKLEKELAVKVVQILTGQADAQNFVARLPVWTDSVPASKLLYEGVNHFDYGRYEEAWLHFRRAVRQDASYADAKYWAARMYYYQLQYRHALAELEPFIREYPKHPRTADAIREIVESKLIGISTAEEAVVFFKNLRDTIGEAQVYEPHGGFRGLEVWNMPAKAWLCLRIAQAKEYLGDYWGAWQEYERAYRIVRPLWPSQPTVYEALEHICKNWDKLWVDGRRIAKEFPEHAFVAGPRNEVFAYKVKPHTSLGNRMPWLVAQDGWLIMEVTVRAIFNQPNKDSGVILFGRGDDLLQLVQLRQSENNPMPVISKHFELVRGLRGVGFSIDYKSAELDRIEIELELWPEHDTASLVVEGVSPEQYQLRLSLPDEGINDYRIAIEGSHAYRADLFPNQGLGGWRPGSYNINLVNLNRTEYHRFFRKGQIELKRGELVKYKAISGSSAEQARQKYGTLLYSIADVRKYPDFLLAHRAYQWLMVYPEVSDTVDGTRRAYVAPGYYDERPRPSIVTGPEGQVHAFWHYKNDIWHSSSSDGRSWKQPQRLSVPVNSAHREMSPQVFRDHLGRYCLVFISDRNLLHRLWPYICTSDDLESWTRPRKICEGESAYIFMYQDNEDNYVLIQDGRQSVWQRRSKDLKAWTAPRTLLTCEQSRAMFRPYVVRGNDGQFYLLVECVIKTGRGRENEPLVSSKPWLVVGSSLDGIIWSNWRAWGVDDGYVDWSYTLPVNDGLLIYVNYYARESGGSFPKLARLYREANGTWWQGGEYRDGMPGWVSSMCQTAEGRVLFTGGDYENSVWCAERTNIPMEVERARGQEMKRFAKIDSLFK